MTVDRFLQVRLAAPTRLRTGLLALAAAAGWYALVIALLAAGGVGPGTAPWLAIPAEDYFFWEALFIGPVIFLTALLAAAGMHLLARAAGGHGLFDDTVGLVGIATAAATLCTLVPDTFIGLALVTGVLDEDAWMRGVTHPSATLALVWVYLTAYLVAFGVLYPAVVRAAYGLRGWRAWAIGWAAFALYQGVLYVFVR